MNNPQIIEGLQQVFDEVFLDQVVVTPQLSAADVAEWDSLLHISLVVAVERKFAIRFRMGEVESTKNVGEFAELIARRIADRAAHG